MWIISEWKKISKDSIQLVELGPGRGTLISDILRVYFQYAIVCKPSKVSVKIRRHCLF